MSDSSHDSSLNSKEYQILRKDQKKITSLLTNKNKELVNCFEEEVKKINVGFEKYTDEMLQNAIDEMSNSEMSLKNSAGLSSDDSRLVDYRETFWNKVLEDPDILDSDKNKVTFTSLKESIKKSNNKALDTSKGIPYPFSGPALKDRYNTVDEKEKANEEIPDDLVEQLQINDGPSIKEIEEKLKFSKSEFPHPTSISTDLNDLLKTDLPTMHYNVLAKRERVQNRELKGPRYELNVMQRKEVQDALLLFNNTNGIYSMSQLKVVIRALGYEPKKQEIEQLIKAAGIQGVNTNEFTLNDIWRIIEAKLAAANTKDEILKAFKLFDRNNSGKIDLIDLKQISNELGENITDEELQEMLDEADINGDGIVDVNEFLKIMQKTSLY